MINNNIFRAYDIRGTYEEGFDDETAFLIGLGYGSILQEKYGFTSCLVGHDNRLSSPSLTAKLISGILKSGCSVFDLGLVTTSMLYWARFEKHLPGIMVTASHNPKEDNGFKFSYNEYVNTCGDEITDFRDYLLKGNFLEGNGNVEKIDITKEYIALVQKNININNHRPLKVIVDLGNGTTAPFIKDLYNFFPLEFQYICAESDGSFPNHHPDPNVEENLTMLKEKVLSEKADLGIAFDGDGDRIGVIDEKGKWIEPDKLMIIIIRDLISKATRKTYCFDVKCSKSLIDEIEKLGGIPIMYRTGASYAQAKVFNDNLIFGGEYSGHLYFNDRMFPNSCGMFAGLRFLEILSNNNCTFSELLNDISEYISIPEEKRYCPDVKKDQVINKIKEYCISKKYEFSDIDGIRVNFKDGWGLVRASNTGPHLTTRFEAKNELALSNIKSEFLEILKKIL